MSTDGPADGPLFVLDGMSLAFRAYFALPADLSTEAGTVTNALHGFVAMLVNMVRDHHPAALAVAFDLEGPTFRDELVPDYKAGRAETPEDLPPQFEFIREVLASLNVPVVGVVGYEADDVLATLATQARDRGCDVVVVTGDRDSFQLVEDPHVKVLYNRRGVSDYALYDEAGIVERTGVVPAKYPMLASLRGDPSDNLPGVPGVGEKTAAKLLNTYGDLDGIFANLDKLSPKLRENLAANEALARTNLTAIPLVRDVPLGITVEDLDLGGWDMETARATFERFELRTLWRRVSELLEDGRFGPPSAGGRRAAPPAPADAPAASGRTARIAGSVVDLATCADAAGAAAALDGLAAAAGEGVVAMAARWEGAPGRTPLLGVVAVADGAEPSGVWLDGDRLGEAATLGRLTAVLGEAPVAGHQVKEVLRSLLPLGADCTGLVMDTAVAAYLLDPSTGDYRLGAVVDALGGEAGTADPIPAGQLALDGPVDGGAAAAAEEAALVGRLVDPLRVRLEEEGLLTLFDEVELPLVRVLARMEVAGIRVDTAELQRIADELVGDCQRLETEIQALAGHEFNVNSTPQLRTVLYDELGLTPGRKTKTGYSTDAATLETLRDDAPRRRRAPALPRGGEAALHLRREPAGRGGRRTAGSTPRSARRWPGPAGSPRSVRTSTTSRCAPTRGGGSAGPSCPPRAGSSWWPTTTRSSCASSPTSRATPAWSRPSGPGPTSIAPWPRASTACRSTR